MSATRRTKRPASLSLLAEPTFELSARDLQGDLGEHHDTEGAPAACAATVMCTADPAADVVEKRQCVESNVTDSSLPAMTGHAVHVQDHPDAGAITPKIVR